MTEVRKYQMVESFSPCYLEPLMVMNAFWWISTFDTIIFVFCANHRDFPWPLFSNHPLFTSQAPDYHANLFFAVHK